MRVIQTVIHLNQTGPKIFSKYNFSCFPKYLFVLWTEFRNKAECK